MLVIPRGYALKHPKNYAKGEEKKSSKHRSKAPEKKGRKIVIVMVRRMDSWIVDIEEVATEKSPLTKQMRDSKGVRPSAFVRG